jgi:hypothetical protein
MASFVAILPGVCRGEEAKEAFSVEVRGAWEQVGWYGVVNHTASVQAVCIKGISVTVRGSRSQKSEVALPPPQFGGDRCLSFDNWHLLAPGEHLWTLGSHLKPDSYPAQLMAEIRFKSGSDRMFLSDAKDLAVSGSFDLTNKK